MYFMFLWENEIGRKKRKKSLDEESTFSKKWSKTTTCYMTAALCSLIEHYHHRQRRRSTLFTCLCPISLFTHLCKIFLKRIACLLNHQFEKGASSVSISPGLFLPPPHTSPCPRPSIPPSPGDFPVPICTLLVTLSTYLVPTECLCNQTYTYPVVRHSNGRLIMKLHRCELTTG